MGLSNYVPNSRISQAGVVDNTADRPATKTCTGCAEEKPFTEFYKNKDGKYGLFSRCKSCHRKSTIAWQKNNIEKTKEINKRYRDSHKEQIAERFAIYYKTKAVSIAQKKRQYREETREQRAEYQKQWYKNNPEKNVEYAHRRRVREQSGDVKVFSERDWKYLLRQYRNCCAYCGSSGKLTKDHVVPVSRGGRHSVGNIVPACGPCNFSKHNRLIVEWKKVS